MALKSSESENRMASYEMAKDLQEVSSKLLTRHEKDLSENAEMFSAAIASLRVLASSEDHALPLIEQIVLNKLFGFFRLENFLI